MFILDSYFLAMNAMEWNRDLTWSIDDIRKSETGMKDKPGRTNNTVSFEAMRKGNIGLCMATQIALYQKDQSVTWLEITAAGMGTNTSTISLVQGYGGHW